MRETFLIMILLVLAAIFVFGNISCASKKTLMVNCEKTGVQVDKGLLDICEKY